MPSSKQPVILCLGNNSPQTDQLARQYANKNGYQYRGLVTEVKDLISGVYQTSIYDVNFDSLSLLCEQINTVVVLDQPIDSYQTTFDFYKTVKFAKSLQKKTLVVFENKNLSLTIHDELENNKSFCALPFVQQLDLDGYYRACCYSFVGSEPLGKVREVKFLQDEKRNKLKDKMIAGEAVPEYCQYCIDVEKKNYISPRIEQTLDWASRLNVKSINEITQITKPVFYEVRLNNLCNLQCRSCDPYSSSLIEHENKVLQIYPQYETKMYNTFDEIDIETFEKVNIAGGEPTIIQETFEFLEKLIDSGHTNKELLFITNGITLLPKFKELIKQLPNVRFEVSIDGFGLRNDYIRSNSKWDKIIENVDYLVSQGHGITFNSVVSIYSICKLSDLIDFLYKKYKATNHLAILFQPDHMNPYLFPDREIALAELKKVQVLDAYSNDLTMQSKIDELVDYYENRHTIDVVKLKDFFAFNDRLDQSRNVKLIDYIPELEKCRSYLTKH